MLSFTWTLSVESLLKSYGLLMWEALNANLYTPIITTTNTLLVTGNEKLMLNLCWNLTLVVVSIGLIFFFLAYGVRLLASVTTAADLQFTIFTYFADLEEEMGSADDGLFFFCIFALVIIWFFFFTVSGGFFFKQISWIVAFFLIVGATSVLIPVFVLKNFGIAFAHYVRGAGRTSNLLVEVIMDIIAVSVMSIRFAVQNIRFVFIFLAFIELYEYVCDAMLLQTGAVTLLNTNLNVFYSINFCLHFILQWFLYLYYLGHLTLLFIAQLSIYFALSFWLFFFLYTTFTAEADEIYFRCARA